MEETRKLKLKHRLLKFLKWLIIIGGTGALLYFAVFPALWWLLVNVAKLAVWGVLIFFAGAVLLFVILGGCL